MWFILFILMHRPTKKPIKEVTFTDTSPTDVNCVSGTGADFKRYRHYKFHFLLTCFERKRFMSLVWTFIRSCHRECVAVYTRGKHDGSYALWEMCHSQVTPCVVQGKYRWKLNWKKLKCKIDVSHNRGVFLLLPLIWSDCQTETVRKDRQQFWFSKYIQRLLIKRLLNLARIILNKNIQYNKTLLSYSFF